MRLVKHGGLSIVLQGHVRLLLASAGFVHCSESCMALQMVQVGATVKSCPASQTSHGNALKTTHESLVHDPELQEDG